MSPAQPVTVAGTNTGAAMFLSPNGRPNHEHFRQPPSYSLTTDQSANDQYARYDGHHADQRGGYRFPIEIDAHGVGVVSPYKDADNGNSRQHNASKRASQQPRHPTPP